MKIRIKSIGEKSVHSWYARFVGAIFEVAEYQGGIPGHYTVIIRYSSGKYKSPQYGYVVETDAEIFTEECEPK